MQPRPQGLRSRLAGLFGVATLVGFGVAVASWVAEAALHTWVFSSGTFASELYPQRPEEWWSRSFVALLFLVLGMVVQWHLTDHDALTVRLRRLGAAVEQAGDGVLLTDARGFIEYVNPAFTRLTGYTLDELRGRTPAVLKSGARDDYRAIWATISQGKVWSGRIVDRRKDGSYYPASLTIAPVLGNHHGLVTHYVGVQHDLSAQVESEERHRQSEKLQTLGTLASGIAHDFNNVLSLVVLQLELAQRHAAGNAELTALFVDISRTLTGAKAMVRQLVSFSRRGTATIELEPLELKPWLDRTWHTLRLAVPDPLELRLDSTEAAAWVRGDEQALAQVLVNLVQNARDVLLPRGHGVITVNWEAVEDGGRVATSAAALAGLRCVWLRVSDDGPGVPAELRDRIFEPFFTTKGERGTGLGLAMVKETMHRHGGEIWVTSEVGQGATFHLLLPSINAPGASVSPAVVQVGLPG